MSGTPFDLLLPVLVVDFNADAANRLAEQLRHGGLQADVGTSCAAAQTATRARRYGTLVVVAEANHAADLHCLADLRTAAPDTWILVISSRADPKTDQVFRQHGADSLLTAPFAVEDLLFRLWALSRRSRLLP